MKEDPVKNKINNPNIIKPEKLIASTVMNPDILQQDAQCSIDQHLKIEDIIKRTNVINVPIYLEEVILILTITQVIPTLYHIHEAEAYQEREVGRRNKATKIRPVTFNIRYIGNALQRTIQEDAGLLT